MDLEQLYLEVININFLLDTNIVSFLLKGDSRAQAYAPSLQGKRLAISFMTVAYMLEKEKANKILFVVPNVSLVVQASEDFATYNYENRVDLMIQQVYAGQQIRDNRNIVIGTYQSLVKKGKDFFSQFDFSPNQIGG